SVMNSRRLIAPRSLDITSYQLLYGLRKGRCPLWLKADMCGANRMSAFGPKADKCSGHAVLFCSCCNTLIYEAGTVLHFTFCCSASFAHSRIFFALSLGIIFSGAVAFTSADATCARNIATKVIAVRNTVGRCLRMNALLWLVRDGSLSRKDARGGR